jgi:hypothetical protein
VVLAVIVHQLSVKTLAVVLLLNREWSSTLA